MPQNQKEEKDQEIKGNKIESKKSIKQLIMKNYKIQLFSLVITLFIFSCTSDDVSDVVVDDTDDNEEVAVVIDDTDFEAIDWTEATHSKDVDPNISEVFEDNTVKRLDFVITEERWQTMLDDMENLYGTFGQSGASGFSDEDPIFVPGEVFYEGNEWYRVGLRFKGNSSLQSSWQAGILKLSFKLDFDEFEDDYPQIKNQRFYGIKKLSLKNNYDDSSMLREKVATDVFRNAGLVASHTAFYTLYVDHGDGPQYFGLYTLVEQAELLMKMNM